MHTLMIFRFKVQLILLLKNVLFLNLIYVSLNLWFESNSLKINCSKTQTICIDPRRNHIPFIPDSSSLLSITSSTLYDTVLNIGVLFDSNFNLNSFIDKKIISNRFQLYRIRKIRRCINFKTCRILISSLVLSVVNHCEELLVGIPAKYTNPIDCLIRQCIRVVYNLPRYTGNDISITSLMKILE